MYSTELVIVEEDTSLMVNDVAEEYEAAEEIELTMTLHAPEPVTDVVVVDEEYQNVNLHDVVKSVRLMIRSDDCD